jgi:hypothetical protein
MPLRMHDGMALPSVPTAVQHMPYADPCRDFCAKRRRDEDYSVEWKLQRGVATPRMMHWHVHTCIACCTCHVVARFFIYRQATSAFCYSGSIGSLGGLQLKLVPHLLATLFGVIIGVGTSIREGTDGLNHARFKSACSPDEV